MHEQMNALQNLIDTAIEFCVRYSFDLLGALIALAVGLWAADRSARLLFDFLESKKMDTTLSKFLAQCLRFTVIGFAAIVALGKFGITIAPLVAALSAVAFGTTFAIQGPLSNYGAGLSIILSRPFKVGDTITVVGVSGVVQDIKLGATILLNEDGVLVTIPNKHIVGETVHNSGENKVTEGRVDISFAQDPEKATELVRQTLRKFSAIAARPEPQIGIQKMAGTTMTIAYRYWVPTAQYFSLSYKVNLAVFKALESSKILAPAGPQEVRVLSASMNQSS